MLMLTNTIARMLDPQARFQNRLACCGKMKGATNKKGIGLRRRKMANFMRRSLRITALKRETMGWIEGDRPPLEVQYNAQGI
jgi:hypothetical protein